METFGIWLAAILTLSIFSFLYKDNPFYKIGEHLFVGVSAGYWFGRYWHEIFIRKLFVPLTEDFAHNFLLLIPFFLGIMMLFRLSAKLGWMSRWPLAFMIGTGSGIYFVVYIQSNVLMQLKGTIVTGPEVSFLNHLVLVIGVLTGLFYFFFSKAHRGAFGVLAKIGIYFLMISFGASFGYTVMARISLLIGRMQFLLGDWLHLI